MQKEITQFLKLYERLEPISQFADNIKKGKKADKIREELDRLFYAMAPETKKELEQVLKKRLKKQKDNSLKDLYLMIGGMSGETYQLHKDEAKLLTDCINDYFRIKEALVISTEATDVLADIVAELMDETDAFANCLVRYANNEVSDEKHAQEVLRQYRSRKY